MIYYYRCEKCKTLFEEASRLGETLKACPCCGATATREFHACTNIYVPSYFHTSRSDIFTDKEWQELKKDPNVERAK
jgi:putative FmdB family regulatory protein